jgi:hypothetical protein
MDHSLDSTPGTYALILALQSSTELQVGCLGRIRFHAPFYLYFGSAFGPGGLQARIEHHLQPARRAHWHIDYLRQAAEVVGRTSGMYLGQCGFGTSRRCGGPAVRVVRLSVSIALARRQYAPGSVCLSTPAR